MLPNTFVRKECSPQKTIDSIRKILNDLGIETEIVSMNKSGNDIYSSRLVIKGTSMGTNGKGVTEELSIAGAYAEFMERLQTGYVFGSLNGKGCIKNSYGEDFIKEDFIKEDTNYKEVLINLKKYFMTSYDFVSEEEANEILMDLPNRMYQAKYYHVQSSKLVPLPSRDITRMCGSNGLCAGNTPVEAVCQGICELFERMSYKTIFMNEIECPTIPTEAYVHTNSMKLISYIESKGYTVIVKDMTLGGKFPVIGVVIISPSKNRIKFSAGSDINFDIAIQRCLTEALQGRELGAFFSAEMQDMFVILKLNHNLYIDNNYKVKELQRAFYNGSGDIPLGFVFNNRGFNPSNLEIFINVQISNETAYKSLVKILNDNKMDLYIRDYSVFGFPTYRVFIPNHSALFASMKNICKVEVLFNKSILLPFKEENLDIICDLLHKMNELMNIPKEIKSYNIFGFSLLNGDLEDTRWLEIILYIYQRNYDKAYITYKHYYEGSSTKKDLLTYLYSLKNNKSKQLKQYFLDINHNAAIERINNLEKDLDTVKSIILNDVSNDDLLTSTKMINELITKVINAINNYEPALENYHDLECDNNFVTPTI